MPNHQATTHALLTAALLTAGGLMLDGAPARAAGTISSCGTTQNVTPATWAAAAKVNGCKILVMSAGDYSSLIISGHSGGLLGVLTLRCASAGSCRFRPSGRITGVDGVIVDGIQVTGGANALYISGRNVLIQNSTFIEQTSAGVT